MWAICWCFSTWRRRLRQREWRKLIGEARRGPGWSGACGSPSATNVGFRKPIVGELGKVDKKICCQSYKINFSKLTNVFDLPNPTGDRWHSASCFRLIKGKVEFCHMKTDEVWKFSNVQKRLQIFKSNITTDFGLIKGGVKFYNSLFCSTETFWMIEIVCKSPI